MHVIARDPVSGLRAERILVTTLLVQLPCVSQTPSHMRGADGQMQPLWLRVKCGTVIKQRALANHAAPANRAAMRTSFFGRGQGEVELNTKNKT